MDEDISSRVAWKLRKAITGDKASSTPQSGVARVQRRDANGTVWLRIPGSTVDTPVTGAVVVNVAAGDLVSYSVGGGRVTITGNSTDPSAGVRTVNVVRRAAVIATELAKDAKAIAEATGQFFWHDGNGAHVSTEEGNPTGPQNALWNSLGMLFRSGANNLLALVAGDDPGMDVYDGQGNEDENVMASYRGSGARIGYENSLNMLIGAAGQLFRNGPHNLLSMTPSSVQTDVFACDGTKTRFELSATPAKVEMVEVNGVYTEDYSLDGKYVVLPTAPTAGSSVEVDYKTELTTLTIYDGTAWTSVHDNVVAVFNEVGARIGRRNGTHTSFTEDGMEVVKGGISKASFSDSARVGTLSGGHVTIAPTSMEYLQGNDSAFAVETVGDPVKYQIGRVFDSSTVTGTHVYAEPKPTRNIAAYGLKINGDYDIALFTDDGSGGYLNLNNGEVSDISVTGFDLTPSGSQRILGYKVSYSHSDDFNLYVAESIPIYEVEARVGTEDGLNTTVRPDGFGVNYAEDRLFDVSSDGLATNIYMGGSTLPSGFDYTDNQVLAIFEYLKSGCTVSGSIVLDPEGVDTTWRVSDDGYGFLYDSAGVQVHGPGVGEIEYTVNHRWLMDPPLQPQSEIPGAPVSIDMGNVGIRAMNGRMNVTGRIVTSANGKLLWSNAYQMTVGQQADLSERIADQPTGIVLVWSGFSGGAQNYQWHFDYVPKEWVYVHSGNGMTCIMAGAAFSPIAAKYVYIHDSDSGGYITGHAANNQSGTTNGITYNNAAYVLREVWGV